MTILFTDNGDKAIELPNKKVIVFSSYQREYFQTASALVADNLEDLNKFLEEQFGKYRVNYKVRRFWCAAAVNDAHEKSKLIKEYQNFARDLDNQNMLPTYSDGWLSRAGKIYPNVRKFLWGY